MANRDENNNMNKQNAKYAFYYLLSFVALVFMALSVGMVFFEIINKSVYDAIDNSSFSSGILQFAISALIIATPIYYLISGMIAKGLRKEELEKDSGIRRWLTYFIILVSSLIILGELISTITNFLSGELTTRFILKALVVAVISAITFTFYFYDIKRNDLIKKDKIVKIFFFASLAIVIAAFISAWFFVDSPKLMRERRLDQIVVNNISSIESAINTYYDKNGKLPDSLEQLTNNPDYFLNDQIFKDPENGAVTIYNKKDIKNFELCANFRTSNKDLNLNGNYNYPTNNFHLAGYQCIKGNLYNVIQGKTINAVPAARKATQVAPEQTSPAATATPSFPTPPNPGDAYYIN